MPLVIYGLGGVHTSQHTHTHARAHAHTHTRTHTRTHTPRIESDFKKPGTRRPAARAGLVLKQCGFVCDLL